MRMTSGTAFHITGMLNVQMIKLTTLRVTVKTSPRPGPDFDDRNRSFHCRVDGDLPSFENTADYLYTLLSKSSSHPLDYTDGL